MYQELQTNIFSRHELQLPLGLFGASKNIQTMAAIIPPMMGATKNIHSCIIAVPPTKTAGPILLAGFTDVPVIGIPTRWMIKRVKPMAIPAKPLGASSEVAPKMTRRKKKVKTTSAMKPATRLNPAGEEAS